MLDTLALRQEALSVSPRVRNAELSLRAAEATASQARSTYWPTLNLSLNQNWSGNNINDYQLFQSRSASLSVNWQLFNRFGREQQAEQASLNVINAEATAEEARRQVVANLTQRLAELGSAEQQVEFARTNVEAATEDLRIVNERYKVGVATIVDVVTSQEQLTTAEVQLVDARFAFLRAKAQLEAILGRTLQ
jgi:outer membrane protein TolC